MAKKNNAIMGTWPEHQRYRVESVDQIVDLKDFRAVPLSLPGTRASVLTNGKLLYVQTTGSSAAKVREGETVYVNVYEHESAWVPMETIEVGYEDLANFAKVQDGND
jgi:hypothetical protein